MLTNRSGRRHWSKDLAQSIYETAFLIDAEKWWCWYQIADVIQKGPELIRSGDVSPEDNHASGLYLAKQVTRFVVELRAWKTDEEELSNLLFEWK